MNVKQVAGTTATLSAVTGTQLHDTSDKKVQDALYKTAPTNMKLKENIQKSLTVILMAIGILSAAFTCAGEEAKPKEVVLLGDTVRQCYQGGVAQILAGKATVWGPEENCRDSSFILRNMDKWLTDRNPSVIYLNCGLVDVYMDKDRCMRSEKEYAENLDEIFTVLRSVYKDTTIIFALTTPVNEEKQKNSKLYGRLVRKNSDINQYNSIATEIANNHNVAIDDLNSLLKKSDGDITISDGINPNGDARQILASHISEVIIKALSGQNK